MPFAYITGRKSNLVRPESITFSTSGKLLGVSNSEAHSVDFFPLLDDNEGKYSTKPSCTISNSACLNYVHDAVLASCGTYLITAARDAHALSLFDQLSSNTTKDQEPLWSFTGKESALNYPTSVAIHPNGKCIAVANRKKSGITLYRSMGEKGHFDPVPSQIISEEELLNFGLASPHGLDFTPDGKFLVLAHKQFRMMGNSAKGESAIAIFEWQNDLQLELNLNPVLIHKYGNAELHSVSVHPSEGLIAVSIEGSGVDILCYDMHQRTIFILESFSIFRIGSSIKGLCFTRDGKQFAVSTELNEVLFFETPTYH